MPAKFNLSFNQWCQKLSYRFISKEKKSSQIEMFREEKNKSVYDAFLALQQRRISNYLLLQVFPEDEKILKIWNQFAQDQTFNLLLNNPLIVPPEANKDPIALIYVTSFLVWDYFKAWFVKPRRKTKIKVGKNEIPNLN